MICKNKSGVPFQVASQLVKAVIISKLDYGCALYRELKRPTLARLDTALPNVLRRILGCLKSTPIPTIYIELRVACPKTRKKKLEAEYCLKKMIKSC